MEERKIKCPACGKMMHVIPVHNEDFHIDICLDGCGGIFFDYREFDCINQEFNNLDAVTNMYIDKTFEVTNTKEIRTCPVCGEKMKKNPGIPDLEIEVDDCEACGAKFLDFAELEFLMSQKSSTEASDIPENNSEESDAQNATPDFLKKRNILQKILYTIGSLSKY